MSEIGALTKTCKLIGWIILSGEDQIWQWTVAEKSVHIMWHFEKYLITLFLQDLVNFEK